MNGESSQQASLASPLSTSIVICTYNRPLQLRLLLDSIHAQSVQPEAVYVVDQSPGNQIAESMESFRKLNKLSFLCVHLKVSFQGLTKARNFGLRHVKTTLTSFIDDDVTLGPNYIEGVLRFFRERSPVLLGGITQFPSIAHKGTPLPNGIWHWYRKFFFMSRPGPEWKVLPNFEATFRLPLLEATRTQYFSGSNFNLPTAIAKQIEFDEKLIWYSIGEDIDFPVRLRKVFGENVWLDPTLPVFHPLPPTEPLSEFLLRVHVLHHYYLFFKTWAGAPSMWVRFMFYWARIGNMLMPALQRRKFKVLPHFGLLKTSVKVELDVFKNRVQVAAGEFSRCISLPKRG